MCLKFNAGIFLFPRFPCPFGLGKWSQILVYHFVANFILFLKIPRVFFMILPVEGASLQAGPAKCLIYQTLPSKGLRQQF